MENKILTPLQLWSDYEPSGKLCLAYQKYQEVDGLYYFEAYINGDKYGNEFVRIFVRGYYPKGNCNRAIIVADGYTVNITDEYLRNYAELGYCVFEFDYCGYKDIFAPHTIYPNEVMYGNLALAGDHLNLAIPSAKNTCVYLWTKICRRVINFAKDICGQDSTIILMGMMSGCDITWQCAGIDNRVNGLVNIINGGWKEYQAYPKFAQGFDLNMDEERERWLTGCSAQSYAMFIKCPTLFIGTTNSTITSVDRIENTLNLIDSNVALDLCAGHCNNIDETSSNLIEKWLLSFNNISTLPENPTVEMVASDNTITVSAEFDSSDDIAEISLYYCFDELVSSVRNWKCESLMLANPKLELPFSAENKLILAYVRVEYRSNWTVSSLPTYLDLSQSNAKAEEKRPPVHIIYQRKHGVSPWVSESNNCFNLNTPSVKTGAYDILGISLDSGNLSTYSIGDSSKYCDNNKILQFDSYSQEATVCKVIVTAVEGENVCEYSANVTLLPQDWTKVSLELVDFKSSEMMPLKDWRSVKKLTLVNPKGLVFNNFIWV